MTLRRPKAVVFDIIETTFMVEPLDAALQRLGLPPGLPILLYNITLREVLTLAAIGSFSLMRACMAGALDEILARHGLDASDADKASVLDGMSSLPPAPDAAAAIACLRAAGIKTFALSNGGTEATQALLRGAGMLEDMQPVVTVEEIGCAKPRREIYHHAAARAGVAPADLMLLAVHPWDCTGAKAAGLTAAFVSRGRPYSAVMTPPDVAGRELLDTAARIAALPA